MPNITPRNIPPQAFDTLTRHGLHPVLARIYAARGITKPEQLETELSLLIPFERLKNITLMATLLAEDIGAWFISSRRSLLNGQLRRRSSRSSLSSSSAGIGLLK